METDDFLREIKKAAPAFDAENFKKTWLQDFHFPTDTANDLLRKNKFMQTLFDVQQMRKKPFAENKEKFAELLKSSNFYPVKTEILYQLKEIPYNDKKELLLLAMQTNDIKTRQAVGEFTDDIPLEFKARYESLLDDKSYDTNELAFMNVWKNFGVSPDDYEFSGPAFLAWYRMGNIRKYVMAVPWGRSLTSRTSASAALFRWTSSMDKWLSRSSFWPASASSE